MNIENKNEAITEELIQVCTWCYEYKAYQKQWEMDELTEEFTTFQGVLLDLFNEDTREDFGTVTRNRKASGVRETLTALLDDERVPTYMAEPHRQ